MSTPPPTMYWHEQGCQCQGCQQARLRQPPPRHSKGPLWVIGGILLVLLLVGGLVSLFNPYVNFPVVSQVVCSLKGDTWYGGGILGSPGCYAPQQP